MTKAYFTRRLLEALTLADEATDAKQRSTYLRASLHYCELLGLDHLPHHHSSGQLADNPPRR